MAGKVNTARRVAATAGGSRLNEPVSGGHLSSAYQVSVFFQNHYLEPVFILLYEFIFRISSDQGSTPGYP